jgi:hypothetical protein
MVTMARGQQGIKGWDNLAIPSLLTEGLPQAEFLLSGSFSVCYRKIRKQEYGRLLSSRVLSYVQI